MKLSRKQIYMLAGITALGVGSFFMFRRRRIVFFDNVWCGDDTCTKITDAVAYCTGQGGVAEGGGRDVEDEKPANLAQCVSEQSDLGEQELIYDAQMANGLIDEDGNVIPTSEQEAHQIIENIENLEGGGRTARIGGEDQYTTGPFNIIFPKPHGLNVGDKIYVQQDDVPEAYSQYNGDTIVTKVYTPYIIATDKPRVGETPHVGGYVIMPSVWSQLLS